MKKYLFSLLATALILMSCNQAEAVKKNYVRMADSEMQRNPESWMVDFSTRLKWNYCHGLELGAIYDVWEMTGDQKYYDYAVSYADTIMKMEQLCHISWKSIILTD